MAFNSLAFFIFFPLVFLLFSVVSDRYRWAVLLLASYIFYGFILKPILLITLTAVILVTFQIGWLIEQTEELARRRSWFWIGVVINIGLLIYFKYLTFITLNINLIFGSLGLGIVLDTPLPLVSIGLSFYIFQAISYLTDIYLRMAKPEGHFGIFALYLSFFPKLLQGPIERSGDLIPQLKTAYIFSYDNVRFGVLLFMWGFFKKVVIADRLGLYVDTVYSDVHAFIGLPLLLATYAYAFQIFMDFSGYTDMALGSARLFNINLTMNFNSPYLATSVADFWRRWHISFSRWILDYIFKPLQMYWRDWGQVGTASALIVTFLVSGVWHGASWGFVVWGGLHGIFLAASIYYRPYQNKLYRWLGIGKSRWLKVWQMIITFNLVSFAWIFFRANNLNDAFYLISNMFVGEAGNSLDLLLSQGYIEPVVMVVSFLVYIFFATKITRKNDLSCFCQENGFYMCMIYNILFLAILFCARYSTKKSFIYLQF